MIYWKDLIDLHMEGTSEYGSVWIRINKKEEVTGMYTMFGPTIKHMPTEKWTQDITGAQLKLEQLYELEVKAQVWGASLRSKH